MAGVVVFGATWLAGNAICVVEQNRYANDRWDGNDLEEFARLSSEAKEQPAYKRGTAIAIAGFLGTGLSILLQPNTELKPATYVTLKVMLWHRSEWT